MKTIRNFMGIIDATTIKVTGASGTSLLVITLTEFETIVKIGIGLVTLAYIIWKWIKEAKIK